MPEVAALEVAVGDEVRVHFHPPGPWRSFSEGVVRRVNITAPEGRFFVVEVTHEVILDREHRISPGFHDYVRYEDRNDFPGRIELLSATTYEVGREPAPDLMLVEPPQADREADGHYRVELEVHSKSVIEEATSFESTQVDVEPQPARKPRGFMAALFGRKR